jgi:hypothetical protein
VESDVWGILLGIAITLMIVMEIEKFIRISIQNFKNKSSKNA